MRKAVLVLALLFAAQTAWSADMGGKIGFGIGQTVPGGDLLRPSHFTMRLGLLPSVVLSSEVFFQMSSDDSKIDTLKTSDRDIGLELGAFFRLFGTQRTNLYGIGQFGFSFTKDTQEFYGTTKTETTTNGSEFGLDLGMGLEHFMTETLSINLNTLSGLSKSSSKTETKTGTTTVTTSEHSRFYFGLENIDCMVFLIWYMPFM